jgi:hypothetical protein
MSQGGKVTGAATLESASRDRALSQKGGLLQSTAGRWVAVGTILDRDGSLTFQKGVSDF